MISQLIDLNFFSLDNQEISFKIYRKRFNNQDNILNCYKAKLPINKIDSKYTDYWITLNQINGFEYFLCSQDFNYYLTIKLIWDIFLDKIKNSLNRSEYIIPKNKFSRSIFLIIKKYNEGNEGINIGPYYLKVESKYGFLVDFRFKKCLDIQFSKKIQQLSLSLDKNFYSNKNYYNDKYSKIEFFIKKYKDKIFPLIIENREYNLENSLFSINSNLLKKKIYVFKAKKEDNSQFKGIKDIGPIRTISKKPLLVFIFQKEEKDLANDVYNALRGFKYPFFFPGMGKMFEVEIKKEDVTKININSFSKNEIDNAAKELEELKNINYNKAIIGIFIEHSKYTKTYRDFSPYYYLKYICTIKKIPLQAITIEQIKKKDGLKWATSGIGLQIFAKLGGIPWKVKPSNEKCIIIGIGNAHVLNEITNEIDRYFAYSVCIDSSGIYKKIDILSNTKDKTIYMDQLRENIKNVILEYLKEDIDKCVIHLPFKIKKDEIHNIKKGVDLIRPKLKKIKFMFIKINTKNKFFGYANNNSKVPYESTYIKLSKNEYLVWFEGLQFGKENIYKKIGNPVHIQFIEDYSLDDKEKKLYLQDIINLSGANWRGFNAKLLPISIYYPEIIAKYISEFRKYTQDELLDISNIKIPWFL